MHDANIDHIGDKRRDLVAVQQLRVRCYFAVGIPATRSLRCGRVRGTKSDNSTCEVDAAAENLRRISKARNNDCMNLCTGRF
jgi:hypothetical protein